MDWTDDDIDRALAEDPAFRLTTVDGTGWIDPFTGEIHPVLFDHREFAREHLLLTRPWDEHPVQPFEVLLAVRWHHHLASHLARDERFRTFGADGRWLNPYTGRWEDGVKLVGERVGQETLRAMARVLARCDAAQAGPPMAKTALDEIARAVAGESTADPGTDAYQALNDGLQRARRVLERMLPQLPELPGWRFHLHYEPQQAIGGDLYDLLPLPGGRRLLVIGDVAGHGPDAALVVVSALKALRFAAPRSRGDVRALLTEVNDDLRQHHQQFLTLSALELDAESGHGVLWLAGHHPALLMNARRSTPIGEIGLTGAAVGMMPGEVFARALRPQPLTFEPGDLLIQCTDGLFEVEGADGEQFGAQRMALSCAGTLDRPGAATVTAAVENARRFARGHVFADDVTVLALARV